MTILRLDPDAVSWREVDGEVIALGHGASAYFSTRGSGALIWKQLAAGVCRSELVDAFVREFGIDESRAAADIDAFISALASKGLLA